MFLVDDVLFSPVHGILWIFRAIHRAVEEEMADEAEAITAKLSELYMMFETGQMTEEEFDAAEKAFLDRLEALEERTASAGRKKDNDEGFMALERRSTGRPDS